MKTRFVLLTTLVVAVLLQTSLIAQTEKGRFIVDSDIALLSGNYDIYLEDNKLADGKSTEMDVNLRFGYTFLDNLEVGILLGVTYEKNEATSFGTKYETTTQIYEYDLFIRYYFSKKKLKPFIALGAGLYNYDQNERPKSNGFVYRGAVGIAYFINKHIGVDVQGNLMRRRTEQGQPYAFDTVKGTFFHLAFGIIISL